MSAKNRPENKRKRREEREARKAAFQEKEREIKTLIDQLIEAREENAG